MLKDLIEERVVFMYGELDEAKMKHKPNDMMNKHMTESYYDQFEEVMQ